MVVEPSIRGNGFEVGDMVWAKMKSQPWWPGHVYSEEFATPLVRQSKREGLLLVALFGASSFAWFDPSQLVPFDSNYAEMRMQSNSRTFVKAVEDAVVEVNRRIGLGLSCICSNEQNFRKIDDVQGFVVVDVAGYDSGAVYSVAAIGKARDSFQPKLASDFLRQLALEADSSEHVDDIDFIKNMATVMSYRKAVFKDFDEPYDLASIQEPAPRETPSKAPLSGMAVLADSLGKVTNTTKRKNHAKKDEYILKRRDESKDSTSASGEFALKDATGCLEDTLPTALEFSNSCFERSTGNGESPTCSVAEVDQAKVKSADDERRVVQEVEVRKVITQDDVPSGPDTIASFQTVVSEPKKVKIPKSPVGERDSGKTITFENNLKQKKEGISSVEKFPPKNSGQPEGPQRSNGNYDKDLSRVLGDLLSLAVDPYNTVNSGTRIKVKKAFLRFRSLVFQKSKNFLVPLADGEPNDSKSSEDDAKTPVKALSGLKRGPSERQREMIVAKKKKVNDIKKLINEKNLINKIDKHVALDVKQPVATMLKRPEHDTTIPNLKFRQGGQNFSLPLVDGEPNAGTDSVQVPPVKTPNGLKRGPPDHQEEMAAAKKNKVGDIKNSTKEKKVTKMIDEPAARVVKQPVAMTPKKPKPELIKKTEQLGRGPTMLTIKFPQGGSLPSYNELKARFARYGPMDHSGTHIFWNTFSCQVVFKHNVHAQAAYRFVVGSSSLFGNTGVKCTLKVVGTSSARPEPPVEVTKEDRRQPDMEARTLSMVSDTSGVQPRSILKKSADKEAAGNSGKGRVKFKLGEENLATNFSTKNFEKDVHPSVVTSATSSSTIPPPPAPAPSMHHGTTPLSPPPSLPPACSMQTTPLRVLNGSLSDPLNTSNVDIKQQMLSLLIRCNDIVMNVSTILGYSPYHPL